MDDQNPRRAIVAFDKADASRADYLVLAHLGRGGWGDVLSARQVSLNRVVSLYLMTAASAEREELRQRFVCEATLLAGLQHPCIPVIYDLGETQDGRPFYTQKPLGGGSWSDVFRRNKRHENLQILSRVADGIGFAHDRGFLHRDIQPDSVVLQAFGEVTIIEWGVAVNLERRQELSQAGTPAYMAPEMARHDIEKIGIRSDVYLLGATLFEIITGKAPHDHGHKSADEKLADAAANKIVAVEASDPLLAVAYTAMAADPEERYESAAEFQDALSRG